MLKIINKEKKEPGRVLLLEDWARVECLAYYFFLKKILKSIDENIFRGAKNKEQMYDWFIWER